MSTIKLFSGLEVDPFNLKVGDIWLVDICHGLNFKCRFGGHSREFYSVAEHSIRVANMVDDKFRLHALLHDAPEAYLFDAPSPIKSSIAILETSDEWRFLDKVEDEIFATIAKAFNIDPKIPNEVHIADKKLLQIEIKEYMEGIPMGLNDELRKIGDFDKRLLWEIHNAHAQNCNAR